MYIYSLRQHFYFSSSLDPTGKTNLYFAIAGANDTEAQSATTIMTTPGFLGKDHKRECLNFWYTIKV